MTLSGVVRVIVYYNDTNGYTIAKIRANHPNESQAGSVFTLTATVPGIQVNETYEFSGEWVEHPQYGKQFKATSATLIQDDSRDGLITYLSSDLFYGVGPKLATSIVDAYGQDAINIILADPSKLKDLGVNERKTKEIHAALYEHRGMQRILIQLYEWNFTPAKALEIYRIYGAQTIPSIEANPYALLLQVERLGFDTIDAVAMTLGIAKDDPNRLQALVYEVVQQRFLNGDTYALLADITVDLERRFVKEGTLFQPAWVKEALEHPLLVVEDSRVYAKEIYEAEVAIATRLRAFQGSFTKDLTAVLSESEDQLGIVYSSDQQTAILTALQYPVSVITGGPGTGKTTIIRGMLFLYQKIHRHLNDVALLAPTGRAAKRITESTNIEARTIHSFLGYDFSGHYEFGPTNKRQVKFVLVDEASMVDTLLLARLLLALPDECQVVLIGDVNQLESVAPGQVLYDILQTNVAKNVYLEKVYRHDNSFLFDVAYAMNQGQYDPSLFVGDVQLIACDTASVSSHIQRVTNELIASGVRMDDIQLLAPMYKGVVGIDALNVDLQQVFNPSGAALTFMGQQFRQGDKVLQLVNQPIDGVMNGEVGRVIEVGKEVKVDFDGVIVSYSRSDLMQLKHAYCMSIHKSQGNEYDVVIIALSMSYKAMLQRKLLYTAATRAKKQLIFVGDPKAFQYAITTQVEPRKTTLQQRLNP